MRAISSGTDHFRVEPPFLADPNSVLLGSGTGARNFEKQALKALTTALTTRRRQCDMLTRYRKLDLKSQTLNV